MSPMENSVVKQAGEAGESPAAERKKTPPADRSPSRNTRRPNSILVLFQDLAASFRAPGFWLYGAWIDTNLKYRAQALGAFWTLAGTLLFVAALGTLYSAVFNTRDSSFYAHLASGYVLWSFLQTVLVQSTQVYSKYRGMIQNGYVRYPDYVLRLFCANLSTLLINTIVIIGAMVLVPVPVTPAIFALLFTIPLFFLVLLGTCFFFSVLGARYPDFVELLRTLLRLGFFITPIIWIPGAVGGKAGVIGAFIYANPFYYLIEIIRAPLVYGFVPWLEIGAVAAAIVVVWLMACLAFARARPYIPLWV